MHEFSKIKVFDYEAIFQTLVKAKEATLNMRFEDTKMKFPVLKYILDESNKLSTLI